MNRAVSGPGWAHTNPHAIPKQGRDTSVSLESDRQKGTGVHRGVTRSDAHKTLSIEPGRMCSIKASWFYNCRVNCFSCGAHVAELCGTSLVMRRLFE